MSRLLDEWIDLPPQARPGWLGSLGPEYATLLPTLRQLLSYEAAGAEGFLATLPKVAFTEPVLEAAACNPSAQQPGALVGPYRLVREAGRGGMGVVWMAERADGGLKRPVALKLPFLSLHPTLAARFARERDILAALAHPNIARLYDAGVSGEGQPYLALEYIEGEAITAYCDRRSLGLRERLRLFLDVLRAVQYAHARLVIHRDLKPSNILVTAEESVRLLDFGIAKLLVENDEAETELTRAGNAPFTLDYASPEQIAGEAVTTAGDVYSLGVLLYELLTGERPYRLKRNTRAHLEAAILAADVAPPSRAVTSEAHAASRRSSRPRLARALRDELDNITLKALQKDPQKRYATADAFAQDIERYLEGEAVLAQPQSAWYRGRKFVQRHKTAVVSTAAVIMALNIGFGVAVWEAHLALAEKRRADTESATARAVTDFLQNDLLAQASPNTAGPGDKPDPDLKVRAALDRAAARVPDKFAKQPLLEASIRLTISQSYRDLGLYADARVQAERAVELRRAALGNLHPDTLSSLNRLADLYLYEGKYAQADSLDAEILAAQQRTLGEQNAETIRTMANLAEARASLRKFPAAEALYRKALGLSRRVLGADDPQTLEIMANLGPLYQNERKYPEALSILTEALDIRRRVSGEQHPETLLAAYNLGTISLYYGDYAKAWPLLAKVHEVWPRVLGKEHPYSLMSAGVVGTFYRYLARYREAESAFEEVLATRRRVLGRDHPNTVETAIGLGYVKASVGEFAEADRLLQDALLARQRAAGPESPAVLRAAGGLAYLYAQEGKIDQSFELAQKTLATQVRVLGEDHANTLDTMNLLGDLYQARRHEADAERLLTKLLELRSRISAPENVFLADARFSLGYLRFSQHRYPEAESLMRQSLTAYSRAGSQNWRTFAGQLLLGKILAAQGKDGAEPLLSSGYRGLREHLISIPPLQRGLLQYAGAIAHSTR